MKDTLYKNVNDTLYSHMCMYVNYDTFVQESERYWVLFKWCRERFLNVKNGLDQYDKGSLKAIEMD